MVFSKDWNVNQILFQICSLGIMGWINELSKSNDKEFLGHLPATLHILILARLVN